MTNSQTPTPEQICERLPAPGLFYGGKIPEPLSAELRRWLAEQLHHWPERVNEDRTCAIGALTDMATAEFCRMVPEIERLTAREAEDAARQFNAGYLIAVANIVNLHDEDVVAEDVLRQLGVGKSVLRGMDLSDYDLKPLRKLFREIERKDAIDRKRVALGKGQQP